MIQRKIKQVFYIHMLLYKLENNEYFEKINPKTG